MTKTASEILSRRTLVRLGRSCRKRFARHLLLAPLLLLLPAAAVAGSQDQKMDSTQVTAPQLNWQTDVADQALVVRPGAGQTEIIKQIDSYFKSITNLRGNFIQTNPNNKKVTGRFYVNRPGRLRFDYDKPSRLRIVADGHWLSIEDYDLKTYDRYPLYSTPFSMILRANVDLMRDATIIDFFNNDSLIIVTLADKSDSASGQIKLFLSAPLLELKEWVITDPQGLDTRIQLANLVTGRKTIPGFFQISDPSEISSFNP